MSTALYLTHDYIKEPSEEDLYDLVEYDMDEQGEVDRACDSMVIHVSVR